MLLRIFCIIFTLSYNVCGNQSYKQTGNVLNKHLYDNALERGLVCNDGSPGGYYLQENPESNLWIFFQQGGGWCYDEKTCRNRITLPLSLGLHPDLISSKNWPPIKYNLKAYLTTCSNT